MTLAAGTRLGPYEVLGLIGAGGMGEVYKAEDTRLDRTVAIKVIPTAIAADHDRRARFEREAKTIAGLTHPHICTLYDVGDHEGSMFLVMEHLVGETLAARLEKGRLPLEQALTIAAEIADALSAAHRQGVIHRDLKPANVILTKAGAKLLDFGLAKLMGHGEQPAASYAGSAVPTQAATLTGQGVIVGTLQYMAPEQLEGKPPDARTDLWALGAILYEMVTGKQAFEGASVVSLMAAIMDQQPPAIATLQPLTPPVLDRLVRRCLSKSPDDRPDTAHDFAHDLRWLRESTAAGNVTASRRVRPTLVAAVGAAALAVGWLTRPLLVGDRGAEAVPASANPVVTSIRMNPGQRLGGNAFPSWWTGLPTRTELVVGSGGSYVIYSASAEDSETPETKTGELDGVLIDMDARRVRYLASRIYLRRLDRLQSEPVAGTEGGAMPFLSPDEGWIGFWADGDLKKVPVGGGLPISLCEVPWPFGFSWGADGRIVFAPSRESGLFAVSAEGGEPIRLTEPDPKRGEFSHRLPHVLPGGTHVLFTIARHAWDPRPRVAILELATGEWRNLLDDGADARFIRTGHLAFLRQGTLMAVPFDPRRLELVGPPVPLVANVSQALHSTNSRYETGAGQFSISSSGSLIYAEGGIDPDRQGSLVWVDGRGSVEPVLSFRAPFFAARVSPDGRRIAYSRLGMDFELWIHDLERGTDTKLAPGGMTEFPQWTPDGTRLVFDWLDSGVPNIYWQPADGSGPMERLTTSGNTQWPSSITPDGGTLAFVEETPATDRDILLLDMRDRTIRPFLNSRHFEGYPEFSPRGQWIAYVTDESGRLEVYVRPFPEGQGRWQISHQGGILPVWSPDRTRLFYRSGERGNEVWTVEIHAGAEFSAGRPRLLMTIDDYERGTPVRTWDVSRDGRRFLAAQTGMVAQRQSITELVLVQNWIEELKAKVPVGK